MGLACHPATSTPNLINKYYLNIWVIKGILNYYINSTVLQPQIKIIYFMGIFLGIQICYIVELAYRYKNMQIHPWNQAFISLFWFLCDIL